MNVCSSCGGPVSLGSQCLACLSAPYLAPQGALGPAAPERELEHVLAAEPVTAFRLWRVVPPREVTLTPDVLRRLSEEFEAGRNPFAPLLAHRLAPAAKGAPWGAPHEHAECHRDIWGQHVPPTHAAPHKSCTCGIWGVKDEAYLHEAIGQYIDGKEPFAFGTVKLWGRWFEHQKGYRAEFAKPDEITLVNSSDDVAAEIAAAYRCTVTVGSEPPDAAEHRRIALGQAQVKALGAYRPLPNYSSYQNYISQMLMPQASASFLSAPTKKKRRFLP